MPRRCRRPSQDVYCDIVAAIKEAKENGVMMGTLNKLRVFLGNKVGQEISDGTVRRAAAYAEIQLSDLIKRKVYGSGSPSQRTARERDMLDRIQVLEDKAEESYVIVDDLRKDVRDLGMKLNDSEKRHERTEDLIRSLAREVGREDLIGEKHSGPSPVGYREIAPLSGPGSSS